MKENIGGGAGEEEGRLSCVHKDTGWVRPFPLRMSFPSVCFDSSFDNRDLELSIQFQAEILRYSLYITTETSADGSKLSILLFHNFTCASALTESAARPRSGSTQALPFATPR